MGFFRISQPGAMVLVACLGVACSSEATRDRFLKSGDNYLAAGEPAKATVQFHNAVEADPLSGQARYRLAEAYVAMGEPENAFRQYVRAADLLPNDVTAQLKAATFLLLASQFEDARTRAEQVLAKDPTNVDAQVVLGNALAGLRDAEAAIAQLNEAIQLDPARAQTYASLALVQVSRGEYGAAKAAFEKAVQTDPKSVAARLALANFQWAIGDIDASQESLQSALDLNPKHLVTHRALAAFFRAIGRPADAEEHLKFVASVATSSEAQFELADFYIGERRADDARRVLEPLSTRAASTSAAQTRLAGLTYNAGQHSSGHQLLDQVLAREPNYALALLLKARWLLNEGNFEQALDRARAAVAASPRIAAGHYIRGLAEVQTHRTADAVKSFTEVLRLNPRAAPAQVQLSNLHLMRNAVDSAVLMANEAIRNAPRSLDGYLARIRAWVARGDVERAHRELAVLRKQLPRAPAITALEARLQLSAGDQAGARASLERTLQLDPQSFEALEALTLLDLRQERIDEAMSRTEALLAAGDETPGVLLLSAKVFLAAGDRQRAEAQLRRSVVRDPLETANYGLLGRILQEDNRLAAARAEFEEIAGREPGNISARLMIGMIAHAQGEVELAQRWYGEVLRLEPRAAMAANNLAAIYADTGSHLDIAQQLAETALEQWPAAAEFQDTLGWVYYQRQLSGQAIPRFQQSIAADPSNPVYHYHLGLAYSKNGDQDRARTALQRAVELSPEFTDAKQALASIER